MTRRLALLFAMGLAYAAGTADAQPNRAARIDSVRTFFRTGPVGDDWCAAAEKTLEAARHDDGLRIFSALLRKRTDDPVERLRATAAFLFARDRLPDTTVAQFRTLWADAPMRAPATESDRVAAAAASLLAAERISPGTFWDGRTEAETRLDARDELEDWMRITTTEGQQEFDSPTYAPVFLAATLLLRGFAADTALRARADCMTSWLLADNMHECLDGRFAGAHARVDISSAMQPVGSDLAAVAWLYFGAGVRQYSREQWICAMCGYIPPGPIAELATRKTAPFEAVEWKRSATRIRHDTVATHPVPKYTFFDDRYAVGSIPGGLIQPEDQQSWCAVFDAKTRASTVFTMQPYSEPEALTPYLPHGADRVFRGASRRNPYFGTVTRTVGGSPFERIDQYRNTVVALYDVPNIARVPAAVAFLPKYGNRFDVDSVTTWWITMDVGAAYLALRPLRTFTIRTEEYGRRLFTPGARNAIIVQLAPKRAFRSYAAFVKQITSTVVDTATYARTGVLHYTTIFGDRLVCGVDGTFLVNDIPRTYDREKLFDSPWIQCLRGSGVMTVRGARATLNIDMRDATTTLR